MVNESELSLKLRYTKKSQIRLIGSDQGDFRKLRSLQKLIQRSYANLLLSVRRITQTNQGKVTAGIDKEVINTPEQRVILVKNWEGRNLNPTRRVEIPKPNGKKRPLGIPTLRDRIEQAIVKNALEPEWEAVFEQNSYGFRPGRSCQDAIEQVFNLFSRWHNWVLEADIKGFFDNIAHESILTMIGNFPNRELIKGWLKAGFVFQGKCRISDRRGKDKNFVLYQVAKTAVERHIKVKCDASPDDPSLKEDWDSRHQKHGKSRFEKGSKLYKIAENQKWICPSCGEPLFNGEEIDTHHTVPVAEGGTDDVENLQHLHKECHKQVHKTQVRSRLK